MNRQYFIVSVLVLALVLFAFPIVSPVPAQNPAVEVVQKPNASSQPYPFTNETVQYQNLSPDAQQWFDDLPRTKELFEAKVVPIGSPPEPWASFVPNSSENVRPVNEQIDEQIDMRRQVRSVMTYIQVEKDDRYYLVLLRRISPHPPQQAVAMRLGSLVGSIGLFGLAGQQWLTRGR